MVDLGDVGIVIIGRNEGQRLLRCFRALSATGARSVYADSGSTDGSASEARGMGVDVIELDNSRPHTAARGRNAGFEYLVGQAPQLRFVQFLDGDCEIAPGWLETAVKELRGNREVAIVCGRRREKFPGRSIYNRLCDMEWDTPVGETNSCGGDFMVRVTAFAVAGGFDESLIAGEEPELCWRLRRAGGKVQRLPAEMSIHDAAIHNFSQWWRRQVRAGHAAAENADTHGRVDHTHYVRTVLSNLAYAVLIPAVSGITAFFLWSASTLLPVVAYAQLFLRVRKFRIRHGDPPSHAAVYAAFIVLVKFPQSVGILIYLWRRKIRKNRSRLIEYKVADNARTK